MTEHHVHKLQAGVLSAYDSIVMAIAGSAPAYTIAASTATMVAACGLAAPGALLWCALPMIGIAFAFSHLGKADVNAGASYSWVRKTMHPALGFLAGWCVLSATTIFGVSGSVPAGQATISLFSESAATNNTHLVIAVGAIWFLAITGLVILGVRITARAQWIMTGIEVTLLAVFAILAFAHTSGRHGSHFSWSWFSISQFHGVSGFAAAALVAIFFYWGWDVTANLGEESRHGRLSMLSNVVGVLVVFVLYEAFAIVINMSMSATAISNDSSNLLQPLGQEVWPGTGGKLLIIAVMLSSIATLETGLIQASRSLFAMGRDHTMPGATGKVLQSRRTPALATVAVAVVVIGLFILTNFVGSVGKIMSDAINATGLQVAVYYGLACIAVLVAYRRSIFKSVPNFFFMGLLPFIGGGFMIFAFVESIQTLNAATKWVGLGAIALAVIPMAVYWRSSPYYRRDAVLDATAVLAFDDPEPEAVPAVS